jgi:hypothetical protein
LAFGKSTEETCSVLKEIHSRCLTWGDMHGASFASHKYVHVHFPKNKRNFPLHFLSYPHLPFTPALMHAFWASSLTLSSPGTLTLHTFSQNCVHKPLPWQDFLPQLGVLPSPPVAFSTHPSSALPLHLPLLLGTHL